jgi:DNA-binding LacI/PurR family transcriptional regulator
MSKATTPPPIPLRLSLVTQTVQYLGDCIRAGEWREHLPGERQLCARLQVSRPTLRTALEEMQALGWLEVTQRQRRRILLKPLSRRAASRPKTVAVLTPAPLRQMPPSAVLVIDALREQLARKAWALQLHVNPSCYGSQSARALEKLVNQAPASAWLLCGSNRLMQLWFQRRRLPCLVFGTSSEDVALPFADANHRATCRHAGALFLRRGHRRLALVLPESSTGGDRESERGMREALQRHGDASLLVLRHRDKAQLCRLLDQALHSTAPPTAYLVARAVHALTVTTHLMRRGKRLPQDAAVLSRDDEAFLAQTSPAISRYSVGVESFARRVAKAVRHLADNGRLASPAIQLMPKLILEETL